jgi:hypothetical protein
MEPLGPDVRRELGRFGPAEGMADLVAAWPAAVGPEIARNAWPARIGRDATLHVHTRDAVWAFELTQRAEEIRVRLGVAALRFAAGPLPELATTEAAGSERTAVRPATLGEARTADSWAAGIADPELREAVARAARASLAKAASDRGF